MRVCVCVCVYLSMCVSVFICVCVCACVCVCVCVRVRVCFEDDSVGLQQRSTVTFLSSLPEATFPFAGVKMSIRIVLFLFILPAYRDSLAYAP